MANLEKRNNSKLALLSILLVVGGAGAFAQEKARPEKAPLESTPITAGQEMFRAYCAVCHGLDGKGKGPAVAALKKEPPDLTQISRKHGRKFPILNIENIIQGEDSIAAHGSRDMPIWGEAFRSTNRDESMVKLKIQNLAVYIESIQQK